MSIWPPELDNTEVRPNLLTRAFLLSPFTKVSIYASTIVRVRCATQFRILNFGPFRAVVHLHILRHSPCLVACISMSEVGQGYMLKAMILLTMSLSFSLSALTAFFRLTLA